MIKRDTCRQNDQTTGFRSFCCRRSLLGVSAEAQAATGTFHGNATGSSRAAVPAASVLLVNQGTGAEINFNGDAQGNFESNSAPNRKYTARTAATDFSPVELKDVILESADHRELGLAPHVRGTSSVAHVSESSVSLLETTISNLSQVIHEQSIVQLGTLFFRRLGARGEGQRFVNESIEYSQNGTLHTLMWSGLARVRAGTAANFMPSS